MSDLLPIERFITTLEIVSKEAQHLAYSLQQIQKESITSEWVESLENIPEKAVELEAFIARFGRMQDTIADKLLPRWLAALAETPGSQIEVLNRAERLGIVTSVEQWLEARKLRNRLIHEYIENPKDFAEDILLAIQYTQLLFDCQQQIETFANSRMNL